MSILFVVFALCLGTAFLTFNLISIMQGDLAAVEKAIDAGMDVNMARNDPGSFEL